MPANIKPYPLYVYSEPATYSDFKGGINLNPSSESIVDNEIRDAVNMDYKRATLVKRTGATKICSIIPCYEILFLQGIFIFTLNESYIIVAADGKLQYGLYNEDIDIYLRPLDIIVDNKDKYDPLNILCGIKVKPYFIGDDNEHNGYIVSNETNSKLIFQNKKKVEGASYNNKFYLASGTGIIEISVKQLTEQSSQYTITYDSNILVAKPIVPYKPNNIEATTYGFNMLSPYPTLCIKDVDDGANGAIGTIVPSCPVTNDSGHIEEITYTASMIVPGGNSNLSKYRFRWEYYNGAEWVPVVKFKDFNSPGKNHITITTNSLSYENSPTNKILLSSLSYKIKCSFSATFCLNAVEDTTLSTLKEENGDYVVDKVSNIEFGETYFNGEELPDLFVQSDYNKKFLTCTKLLVDGNKFIFYDDNYNSGLWYKTIIDNISYSTYRGGINFKTTKNESIVKAVHFKSSIIVFSNNKLTGGNISIVTGNGDDYVEDKAYSPYVRRIINNSITCDCADSVQVGESLLFFKYGRIVYCIEGSEVSNDVVSVYSMNDNLVMSGAIVDIPWEEDCLSEITENYYALLFKEVTEYNEEGNNVVRPAMRLKMYYKIGQQINNKVYFPWLRDEGSVFNASCCLTINGIQTIITDMDMLAFNKEQYLDKGESYRSSITFKAYDLNYPKMFKLVDKIILYYKNGNDSALRLSLEAYNESGFKVISTDYLSASIQDLQMLKKKIDIFKSGATALDTKVFNAKYMFLLLQCYVILTIDTDDAFSFNSMTFSYTTCDVPDSNPYDMYSKTIRKTTLIHANKKRIDSEKNKVFYEIDEDCKNLSNSAYILMKASINKLIEVVIKREQDDEGVGLIASLDRRPDYYIDGGNINERNN